MRLAPIVLFTYNRPWHTQETVKALLKNAEVKNSDLIVFSDGPKDDRSENQVREVRRYLYDIVGFRSVHIVERDTNLGLADSIISGVTEVMKEYGRVIVLEDDIVTSPYFLIYMNKALEFYENEKKVWHISGWSYPIDPAGLPDTFLWRVMNCWGWATWADRWSFYKKNCDVLIKRFSKKDIKRFNLDGYADFWKQVVLNYKGKINTWAIFWYATIFTNEGLCLNPSLSYTLNIGHDGSGTHCKRTYLEQANQLNQNHRPCFPINIREDQLAVQRIKKLISGNRYYFIESLNKMLNLIGIK